MAGEVVSQEDWFNWSLNQFAREFGIARETVQSRLRAAGVNPSGERRGFPVYSVSAAARAILMPDTSANGMNDPAKMSPKERADWYRSENERLKFERESGLAVGSADSREQMATIAKMGLQVLETLPDILERDHYLDHKIISSIEERIDALREQWAQAVAEA